MPSGRVTYNGVAEARMKLLTFGAIVVISLTTLTGQQPKQAVRTDLTCVENMSIPQYDGGAWVARFTGTARVLISVGTDGAQVNVSVLMTSQGYTDKQYAAWLWASLQDAKFSTRVRAKPLRSISSMNCGVSRHPRPTTRRA